MPAMYDWCDVVHGLTYPELRSDRMTDVRIITEPLGGSPLSLMLQRGEAPPEWCATRPNSTERWKALAAKRASSASWADMWSTLDAAIIASGPARDRLERVRREGGVVITTGQQPGLFGGPIYTWSKAMSALALADAVERELGIACAPMFWAATDDADFAEAAFTIVAVDGGAEVLRSANEPVEGTPMAFAPLGDLSAQRARLRAASGSAADTRALDAGEQCYGEETATVGGAYVALLAQMLSPLGVAVIDASHDAVRAASEPMLRRALEKSAGVEEALIARRGEIERRGLEPQVVDVKGLSLVFAREHGIKRRIATVEAAAMVASSDALLTPNVLLRPIVEAAILPTISYVGGPGEIAYFAQVGAVADALGVEPPLVVPRWSCTLIEPRVQALLNRLDVQPDALARPDALESRLARQAMSNGMTEALAALRASVEGAGTALAEEARALGMDGALTGAKGALNHRVDRLERRLVAAVKRREHALLRDVATLRANLYPLHKRQERALNIIPILSRNGCGLLNEMRDAAATHADALIAGR